MSRICILYFEGCPNHPPAVAMAQTLVAEHRLSAQVEEVQVGPDEVEEYRFLGSPTVQVDGVDIEPAARALRCPAAFTTRPTLVRPSQCSGRRWGWARRRARSERSPSALA